MLTGATGSSPAVGPPLARRLSAQVHLVKFRTQFPFQRQRLLGFQIDTNEGNQRIGHYFAIGVEGDHGLWCRFCR